MRAEKLLKARLGLALGILFVMMLSSPLSVAVEVPLSLFPLKNYDQNADAWINPSDPHYHDRLVEVDYQEKRLEELNNHYFSTAKDSQSPWNEQYVAQWIKATQNVGDYQKKLADRFSNENKDAENIGYGENFRPYDSLWIEKIITNMNLDQFNETPNFNKAKRAILIQNTYARVLPTMEVHLYHFTIPGQGYPFDNLQMSALWAGTPVYILGQSLDQNYSLVLTPDLLAWVKSEAIAKVDNGFIHRWQQAAKQKLVAIISTDTPVMNIQNKTVYFNGYVGSFFPAITELASSYKIMVPVKDFLGKARIQYATVDKQNAAAMPLLASPYNFSRVIKTLKNRPYGWGGMYFYNDCSAELKNLFVPFGFWLPRHSAHQAQSGKMVDKSNEPLKARLDYFLKNARPFMTIVYRGEHTFMYIGNFNNTYNSESKKIAMTYQNIWGLKPADKSRRAVIGQSVFLPLLESFPEDPGLNSEANQKFFQVIFLDQWPDTKPLSSKINFSAQFALEASNEKAF